jgi:hypothetical protein
MTDTQQPLAEWTPVEIDTVLADLWSKQQDAEMRIANYKRAESEIYTTIEKIKNGARLVQYRTALDGIELMEKLSLLGRHIVAEGSKLAKLAKLAAPYEAEYVRRGCWNRVFLALSHDGHAHNGTECSTCHRGENPTQFAWLVQYSGKTEAEIVADAGWRACTTCYPSAPVGDDKTLPTKMFSPDEIEAAKAREEREQAKAKRASDKAAKGITAPDGSPLRGRHGRLETERAAVLEATEELAERYTNRRADQLIEADPGLTPFISPKDKRERWEAEARGRALPLIEAIAHKRGETVEAVLTELEAKAYAKAKRDMGGDWAQSFRHNATWQREEYDAYKAKCEAEGRKPFEVLSLRWPKFQ